MDASSPSAGVSRPAALGRPNRCSISSAIVFVICASGLRWRRATTVSWRTD